MKKIFLLTLGILLMSTLSFANPFLVCDPQPGITGYKLTGPPWVPATVIAQADGSLKIDVAQSAVGLNTINVVSCVGDALWGEVCATPVPFVYTKPSLTPPGPTSGLKLIP